MSTTIYDLTTTEIAALQDLAVLLNGGDILQQKDLTSQLLKFGAGYKAAPVFTQSSISAGIATVERNAQLSYVRIDTESLTATDDIIQIDGATGAGFYEGDLLICTVQSAARTVVFQDDSTGNLRLTNGSFTADRIGAFIALRWSGTEWVEQYRYPLIKGDQLTLAGEQVYISASVATISAPYVTMISELTGETLATGTITITVTAGAKGEIIAYSDEGVGNINLGSATYSAPTTPTALGTALAASINTGTATHGYTASDALGVVTVSAPTGTGAAANGYTLSHTETGGVTAATVSFAGGADGSEQDDTLAEISTNNDGRVLFLYNGMTSNIITIQNLNPDTALPGNISINGSAIIQPNNFAIFLYDGTSWIFFDVSGLLSGTTISKTAVSSTPYNITDLVTPIQYYWVDTSGGLPITVNLPAIASVPAIHKIIIKDSGGNSAVDNIIIDANGAETIDDALTYTINTNWNSITLVHDGGTNWEVI